MRAVSENLLLLFSFLFFIAPFPQGPMDFVLLLLLLSSQQPYVVGKAERETGSRSPRNLVAEQGFEPGSPRSKSTSQPTTPPWLYY